MTEDYISANQLGHSDLFLQGRAWWHWREGADRRDNAWAQKRARPVSPSGEWKGYPTDSPV